MKELHVYIRVTLTTLIYKDVSARAMKAYESVEIQLRLNFYLAIKYT
jgi:hypothetical protein